MTLYRFTLNGAHVAAHPSGALWWEEAGTLVVSDLHLEKGSAYAARGVLLPPYDTAATLDRLEGLIAALAPVRVVALGDSFHDGAAGARMAAHDRTRLAALAGGRSWIWIEGNHDPAPPVGLPGERRAHLAIGPLLFRHEPQADSPAGEVAGHLHPCAAVVGGGGRRVRRRAFATDGRRLVLPAFGAYAGGLNVCDAAFRPLFPQGLSALALGRAAVSAIDLARLAPDGPRYAPKTPSSRAR